MFQHLLVPLDGSDFAEHALTYALSLARQYGSQITLLRVLPPGRWEWEGEMRAELPDGGDRVHEVERSQAELYLEEKKNELDARGVEVTAILIPGRGVAEAILDTAVAEDADTIIIATHGLTGIQRWMIGSVAERVMRHAPVPVLLIRASDVEA